MFAAFAGGIAEFRLGDAISAAALRTPDTKASARGAGWVRFAPRRLDAHARDRAIAWFESAWRHADAELAGATSPVPSMSRRTTRTGRTTTRMMTTTTTQLTTTNGLTRYRADPGAENRTAPPGEPGGAARDRRDSDAGRSRATLDQLTGFA